jgi:phospho-N-acetylmuramoyl-pentapeptide-transferase
MELLSLVKMGYLATLSFVIAFALTPVLTHFLYKYRMGKQIRDSATAPIMAALHAKKSGTPTMGGILIWVTMLIVMGLFHFGNVYIGGKFFSVMDFFSRRETLLPLGALVASALVGLVDDYWNVRRMGPNGGGLGMRHRLLLYTIIAVVGAAWFYLKLGFDVVHVPFVGDFSFGWWYVPFFVFVLVATSFSVNEADGLDGLSGGTLLTSFAAYSAIAFLQGRFELATFCAVIVGALLAFLWFNIAPARFFMGDTGAMALGVTLGVVAMLTNTPFLLPIIGLVFVIESSSVIIQMISKKLRGGKKVFLSSPIHHHFEAIGWPETKIVMRFWIISAIAMMVGLILAIIDIGILRS